MKGGKILIKMKVNNIIVPKKVKIAMNPKARIKIIKLLIIKERNY